ncbi:hypothetical protein MCEMIHM21_00124 [Candidatus Pelagibacterales bacterium]
MKFRILLIFSLSMFVAQTANAQILDIIRGHAQDINKSQPPAQDDEVKKS